MHDDNEAVEKVEARIESRYSNFLRVGYNQYEFLLEFGQLYGERAECVLSRIVTTPAYAKEFAMLLVNSLDEYERKYSEIRAPEE